MKSTWIEISVAKKNATLISTSYLGVINGDMDMANERVELAARSSSIEYEYYFDELHFY